MSRDKELSRSRAIAAKVVHAALKVLHESGNELPIRELSAKIEDSVVLDSYAKQRYEKTGYVRWESILHFYSIGSVKAGHIIKKKGVWYLTTEGENALNFTPEELLRQIDVAYEKWRKENPKEASESGETEPPVPDISYDEIEQRAIEGLQAHINAKNAYEFQDLVAALLRGMGYFTPFVPPRGKDGGVDVMAYRDPLGTESPRIQVQIKHRQISATVQEVRQLMGLLQKEGDVGIFVSTSGFTPDAKATARASHVHVELIDLNRFIDLWQQFYNKLHEEDKNLLPLRPIYFLAQRD